MYRFLIIEDESDMAAELRGYLDRYARARGVEFDVQWVKTAFEFVESKQKYDLIFMDIGLPGINGLEASELLRTYDDDTLIIFVTNLAQYAVRGYEVGALDFLVKPVSYHGLSMRLDRALRIIDRKRGRTIAIPTKYGMQVVHVESLLYVEVHGHDLEYHLEDGTFSLRGTLSGLEEKLGGGQFVRISNSLLVNAEHIRTIDGPTVLMTNGEKLTMSRNKRKAALQALADYYGGSR